MGHRLGLAAHLYGWACRRFATCAMCPKAGALASRGERPVLLCCGALLWPGLSFISLLSHLPSPPTYLLS